MGLRDKRLEKALLATLKRLEQKQIDAIGPTKLRHRMSELVVDMRTALVTFNEDAYEKGKNPWN